MNLCIDQGNSRTKLAIFADDGKMVNNFIYKRFDASEIEKICSLYPVTNSIISSVINIDPAVVNTLNRLSEHFILFDHNTPVPLENKYATPQTLGQDRLAAAVGANALSPNKNLLIIDAGSAITYDFVNADNQFVGGNIAPGIKMRFTALKTQTKKLPLVEIGEKQKRVGQFETFMTGGGSAYLQTTIRQPVTLEKHLVLIGLNRILTYNLH